MGASGAGAEEPPPARTSDGGPQEDGKAPIPSRTREGTHRLRPAQHLPGRGTWQHVADMAEDSASPFATHGHGLVDHGLVDLRTNLLAAAGQGALNPFGLSPSKPFGMTRVLAPFDGLRANGGGAGRPFDWLRAIGTVGQCGCRLNGSGASARIAASCTDGSRGPALQILRRLPHQRVERLIDLIGGGHPEALSAATLVEACAARVRHAELDWPQARPTQGLAKHAGTGGSGGCIHRWHAANLTGNGPDIEQAVHRS